MMIDGNLIQGGQNIILCTAGFTGCGTFQRGRNPLFSGEFIFMIFGLPGAALAMYRCAKPDKEGGRRPASVSRLDQHADRHHGTH